MKRTLVLASGVAAILIGASSSWAAPDTVALDGAAHQHAVRHGALSGVATATPFVASPLDGNACAVASACRSYRLRLTLPGHQRRGELDVNVRGALASGPYALRLLNSAGKVVAAGNDVDVDGGDGTTSSTSQGADLLVTVPPGSYTFEIALTAGQSSYSAAFDWRAHR